MFKRQQKCKVPSCKRLGETRGVCKSCYTYARKLVLTGQTTWTELESWGLVDKAHAAPKNELYQAFLEKVGVGKSPVKPKPKTKQKTKR